MYLENEEMGTIKKKILFIINPISGGKSKGNFKKVALQYLDLTLFLPQFVFTERVNHGAQLAENAINEGFDIIVAVGGDGTINEVAKVLVGTGITLGIVPKGSGNGLARALYIPIAEKLAIQDLNKLNSKEIDVGYINEVPFFNMAGMGFDALISSRFSDMDLRGPLGYMKTVFTEITNYKPLNYAITIDGITIERTAFMISIANSPQYGNEAYISPSASVEDGLLDICIVKPFPLVYLPKMLFHLFSKTANKTEYVEIILGKSIQISRSKSEEVHVDGEPLYLEEDLRIRISPKSLKVICAL